jgi:hypothetical protein
MTLYAAPICLGCTHFRGYQQASDAELDAYPQLKHGWNTGYCAAYPGREPGQTDAIPKEIWTGAKDHRQPVSGDQGIRFDPKTADDAAYAAMIFDRKRS